MKELNGDWIGLGWIRVCEVKRVIGELGEGLIEN